MRINEDAIGTFITLPDGRQAEVQPAKHGDTCYGCIFFGTCCTQARYNGLRGYCMASQRSDRRNIIYKEIK